MPLKIQLKPKERVIINGAVIEGDSDNRSEIVVLNNASVLRQKHILQPEEANTPVKRLYFALQMLYIEEVENHAPHKKSFDQYHKDLDDTLTLPTIKASLVLIKELANDGKYYDALKVARDLIKVEAELFKYANPMED
jgi:flagellar protein FlbT